MALDNFVGKWQETTKEGFDDLASAIGLPGEKKDWYEKAKTEISYARDGDEWVIDVGVAGHDKSRMFRFRLGETYDSESIDGSKMKSMITADGGKFIEKHTGESLQGAEMDIERWIDDGLMVVKTICNGAVMKSKYKRL